MAGLDLDFNSAPVQGAEQAIPDWAAEPPRYDAQEVKRAMLANLEGILGHLFPNGFAERSGRVFYIGSTSGEAGESLNVTLTGDKAGLWYDFATGDGGDILDLWRLARGHTQFADAIRDAAEYSGAVAEVPRKVPRRRGSAKTCDGHPTATYDYRDRQGQLIAQVDRFEWSGEDGRRRKAFRPWDVSRRTHRAPEPRPLYNLPGIAGAPEVIFVEGEKCVEALKAAGIPATCAMGGSNAPTDKTDWMPLAGLKVTIWPDNDDTGRKYAHAVAEALRAVRAHPEILTLPPGRPEKWDAADAIADGEDPAALIREMRGNGTNQPQPLEWQAWQEIDLSRIPRVQFVYSDFYARGYTSVTYAAPKTGKSMLGLAEAIDAATGRGFLTGVRVEPQVVVYYNAEDDQDIINARVSALLKHYGIPQSDIAGRFYAISGVETGEVIFIAGEDGMIRESVFQAIEDFIKRSGASLLVFDPLQDLSDSPETNEVFRRLGRRLRKMASTLRVAVGLIHHTRKIAPGMEPTIDDGRGGSALRGTARFNRILAPMTEAEGAKAGVLNHRYFMRIADTESNLAPPSADVNRWFQKVSVLTASGEHVGAVEPWQWPDAFDGVTADQAAAVRDAISRCDPAPRESGQSHDWAGHVVADVLGLDMTEKADKARVSEMIKTWVRTGVLAVERHADKRTGRDVPVIVPGPVRPGPEGVL